MRKWGILVTAFYVLVVLFALNPLASVLASIELGTWPHDFSLFFNDYFWWPIVFWAIVLIAGQALLLFVSVDTSFRRNRPRRHIAVSIATVALMVALMSGMIVWSILLGFYGDDILGSSEIEWAIGFWILIGFFWVLWGIAFYFSDQNRGDRFDRLVGWLLRGSILELLIVVPCHIIVRHRENCSAPIVTGYGIATGIAVMLLSFGPGVLFLYSRKMAQYQKKQAK